MTTTNPAFGRWAGDDDPENIYGSVEVADPRAEREFDEVLERVSREQERFHRGPVQTRQVVSPLKNEAYMQHGASIKTDPYARPFKRKEARKLLESAGIRCQSIIGTYLADHNAMFDPATGRGPAWGQCVMVKLSAEDGTAHNVHLFFVFDERKGWRLHKAALEK